MMVADIVAIALVAFFFLFGLFQGFGGGLKFYTGGIFGKIISVIVCYFLFGIVLSWPFVQALLDKFVAALNENGSWFCTFLLKIRIDLIVFGVALFIVVQILRKFIVAAVSGIFEINAKPMRVINRLLGILLSLCMLTVFALVVFQIIAWVGGTEGDFYQSLQGSVFKLDEVFKNNPINSIFQTVLKALNLS